jgi:hypothetical protein
VLSGKDTKKAEQATSNNMRDAFSWKGDAEAEYKYSKIRQKYQNEKNGGMLDRLQRDNGGVGRAVTEV